MLHTKTSSGLPSLPKRKGSKMIDLGKGTWISYQPDWLTTEKADELFSLFRNKNKWVQRSIFAFEKPNWVC